MPRLPYALLGLILCTSVIADDLGVERPIRLPKVEFPTQKAVLDSIDRGCTFLRNRQNPDGSWGSARNTKGLNIYAPVPGSHRAFRLAVTALSTAALIENKGNDSNFSKVIGNGEEYLLEKLPYLRRATPMAIYNVWAHAYGIQALTRMHERIVGKSDASKTKRLRIENLIRHQFGMLGFVNDVLRLGVKIGNDAVIQHGGDGRSAADDNCIFMVRLYGFQIVVQGWAGTDHKSRHIAGLLGAFEYPRRLLGQIKIRIVDHIQFVVDEARREHQWVRWIRQRAGNLLKHGPGVMLKHAQSIKKRR